MALPHITTADVVNIVQDVTDVKTPSRGGQKLVFPCKINDENYVLKFLLIDPPPDLQDVDDISGFVDEVFLRVNREVEIMQKCRTLHIAKLGPIPLTHTKHGKEEIMYFSEEYYPIALKDQIASQNHMSAQEIIRLARNMTEAIHSLWVNGKVHRDIKPGNIMQCSTSGNYVLLDMGLAYDLDGDSFTATGLLVGTPAYLSPDQLNLGQKHNLDFRSDMFSLGTVLYEACAKSHPFKVRRRMTNNDWFKNIINSTPQPIGNFRNDIPVELEKIIMRLLSKRSHQRYKSCDKLDEALSEI